MHIRQKRVPLSTTVWLNFDWISKIRKRGLNGRVENFITVQEQRLAMRTMSLCSHQHVSKNASSILSCWKKNHSRIETVIRRKRSRGKEDAWWDKDKIIYQISSVIATILQYLLRCYFKSNCEAIWEKKVKKLTDPQIFNWITDIFEILTGRVISQDAAKQLKAFGIFHIY